MRKNSFFKTLVKCFAIVASIGGVLYLCKDKILSSPLFNSEEDNFFTRLKEKCPCCCNKEETYLDEEEEEFDDVFSEDPANDREYVSLNITSPNKEVGTPPDTSIQEETDIKEDISFDADQELTDVDTQDVEDLKTLDGVDQEDSSL